MEKVMEGVVCDHIKVIRVLKASELACILG